MAISIFNENYMRSVHGEGADSPYPTKAGVNHVAMTRTKLLGYVGETVEFMLHTSVREKLGLSFNDLMNMDIGVYQTIHKAVRDHRPKENKALDELKRDLER